MITSNYIPAIFVCVGIASDNLMLSAISGSLTSVVKPVKLLFMLFMLLTIQMQAFLYGYWLAKLLVHNASSLEKWIALSVLIATMLRMYQEFKLAQHWKNDIPFGLDGFLNISFATSIYVLVLGFSMCVLQVNSSFAYPVSIANLTIMLLIGWYAGKGDCIKTLAFIKKASLIIMAIGIMIFLIQ
jgi:putative Mn2+ efflux pump MntP